MTRGELQDLLAEFSSQDGKFRNALADNPGDIVARQFGLQVPAGVTIKAVQETANTVYVVIPHVAVEGAELGDADLERVSGGCSRSRATSQPISGSSSTPIEKDGYTATCGANIGAANTQTVINI